MPVAHGKVEMKVHVPKRAYDYIKRNSSGRGMGQFLLDMVICHEKQGAVAEHIVSIEDKLARLIDRLESADAHTS
jgi:hypothetical protein